MTVSDLILDKGGDLREEVGRAVWLVDKQNSFAVTLGLQETEVPHDIKRLVVVQSRINKIRGFQVAEAFEPSLEAAITRERWVEDKMLIAEGFVFYFIESQVDGVQQIFLRLYLYYLLEIKVGQLMVPGAWLNLIAPQLQASGILEECFFGGRFDGPLGALVGP